jgi:hypothetical protein
MTYGSTILGDSPVAYWPMGEASGNPQDASGNAHHVTSIGGAPTYGQTGPVAGTTAIAFNGTTDVFTVPTGAGLAVGDVFTYEAWIIRGATGASRGVLSSGASEGYLRILNTGELTINKTSVGIICTSTIVTPASGWHHMVATKNGTAVKLYIDAVDVTGSISNQTCLATAQSFFIGSANGAIEFFNGSIGQAALYNYVLTPAQVSAHYAAATAVSTPGIDINGIAAAIASRFNAVALTAPAGYATIRNSTANPPASITTTPTVIVTANGGEFDTGNGDRQSAGDGLTFWVRLYLDQVGDTERAEVALRKWASVLIYQLRGATQLGGAFPEVTRATINSYKIGILTYSQTEFFGIEMAVSVQTAEGWLAVA